MQEHLGEVVLLDVRQSDGIVGAHDAYLAGHLPGAVWVDLDVHLATPPTVSEGRHPLPSPEAFALSLSTLGVGPDRVVVAYDQGIGAFAARLVWMLRVLGQDAALLDGGLAAWAGPLETGEVIPTPVSCPPRPWPGGVIADLDEVIAASTHGGATIVDARAPARFRGEVEPFDSRAGHIPGAVNLPFEDNVVDDGRLLAPEQLEERFRRAGIDGTTDVIVYCGSGVTACHDVLAMELAGVSAKLFIGSWSQWSGRPELPLATGA